MLYIVVQAHRIERRMFLASTSRFIRGLDPGLETRQSFMRRTMASWSSSDVRRSSTFSRLSQTAAAVVQLISTRSRSLAQHTTLGWYYGTAFLKTSSSLHPVWRLLCSLCTFTVRNSAVSIVTLDTEREWCGAQMARQHQRQRGFPSNP